MQESDCGSPSCGCVLNSEDQATRSSCQIRRAVQLLRQQCCSWTECPQYNVLVREGKLDHTVQWIQSRHPRTLPELTHYKVSLTHSCTFDPFGSPIRER